MPRHATLCVMDVLLHGHASWCTHERSKCVGIWHVYAKCVDRMHVERRETYFIAML